MVVDTTLRLLMIKAKAEDGFNTFKNPRNALDVIILDIIVLNVILGYLMTKTRECNHILPLLMVVEVNQKLVVDMGLN